MMRMQFVLCLVFLVSSWQVVFSLHLSVDRIRPACDLGLPARVEFTVSSGTPPYRVEAGESNCTSHQYGQATCLFVPGAQLSIVDSNNLTARADIWLPTHVFLASNVTWVIGGQYALASVAGVGGVPPYTYEWNNGSRNASVMALLGTEINVKVKDNNDCSLSMHVRVPQNRSDGECPSTIASCAELPFAFALRCLRTLFPDLMSGRPASSFCANKAAALLVYELIKLRKRDHGPAFAALRLLGPPLHVQIIHQILDYDYTLSRLFQLYTMRHLSTSELLQKSLAHMLGVEAANLPHVDTLIVSPNGFENEPIFAPQLVHGSHKVACLLTPNAKFPSSLVQMLSFPLSFEGDVVLAALYVKAVIDLLKPRWVFPGDSGGILVIAKAGLAPYPPPALSKLAPGHEVFSPQEVIISQDDGLTQTSLDLEKLDAALDLFNGSAFLKREYSDASRGVHLASKGGLEAVAQKVLPRRAGPESMDLQLKVRIFAQKQVEFPPNEGALIKGFRFYARQGLVVAAHTSQLVGHTMRLALEYMTIRDEKVEELSRTYIASIAYDGFGALWWIHDTVHGPLLIDFNARLERHICIAAVLPGTQKLLDPCVYFALGLEEPFQPVPAGHYYSDPIRLLDSLKENSTALWNVRRDDIKLMDWITAKCGSK